MDGDDGEESEKAPVLTLDEVKKWSKALLEVRPFYFVFVCLFGCGEVNVNVGDVLFCFQHRSLRALRKLLIAFRAAAHMNEEDQVLAWTIDSSKGNWLLCYPSSGFSKQTSAVSLPCSIQQVGYDRFEVHTRRLGSPLSR